MNWTLGMQKGMIVLKNSNSKDRNSKAGIMQRTLKQKENKQTKPSQQTLICKRVSS